MQEENSTMDENLENNYNQKEKLNSEEKEHNYLPCEEYQEHFVTDKENNLALFKHKNGKFYFVLYDDDGGIKIRSEGFETDKNRNQKLSGVLKYHNHKSMYIKLQKGTFYMNVLHDKHGREVGRSCPLQEEGESAPDESIDNDNMNTES